MTKLRRALYRMVELPGGEQVVVRLAPGGHISVRPKRGRVWTWRALDLRGVVKAQGELGLAVEKSDVK